MTICNPSRSSTANAPQPHAAPLNILFYGNSFTNASFSPLPGGLPALIRLLAQVAGHPAPNVENASIDGASLAGHLQNRATAIHNPLHITPIPGFQWSHIVLQEISTKPTDITHNALGNPSAFQNDLQTLLQLARAHSPSITPILFETWARSPRNPRPDNVNTTDLDLFYPSTSAGHLAKSDQMQSELRRYYRQALAHLGHPHARIAPVGDAFQNSAWDITLYAKDGLDYHQSAKGALLAALVLFSTIYQTPATTIPYSTLNTHLAASNLSLSHYATPTPADFSHLTSLAASSLPIRDISHYCDTL